MENESDRSFFEKIGELEKKCFPDPWDGCAISDMCSEFSRILYEEDEKGNVSGYIFFNTVYENCEVLRLCVDPEFRRRGIAGRLISECKEKAREAGCGEIYLEVRRKNVSAISLYEKTGFEMISVRPGYYPDGDDALLYMFKLQS